MNDLLKISVVTPNLNRADYLEDTILSVIRQEYGNLEYFVMDGGSTDSSLEIIRKYEPDLTSWSAEPDNGMYEAIQKGFEKSSGEIMAWINSDDKYHPWTFQVVNQIFQTFPEVEWIIGMAAFFNKDGACVKVEKQRKWAQSRFWLEDYKWIQQEAVFWRRSLWNKAGGYLDISLKYAADFELWCRFFQYAQLHSVLTTLGGFRLHGQQISLIYATRYEEEAEKVNKAFKPEKSLSFFVLKLIWYIKKSFDRYDGRFFTYLSVKASHLVDKLHNFPEVIYYDFSEGRWKK